MRFAPATVLALAAASFAAAKERVASVPDGLYVLPVGDELAADNAAQSFKAPVNATAGVAASADAELEAHARSRSGPRSATPRCGRRRG